MPGDVTHPSCQAARACSSADLSALIGSADLTDRAATVIGSGNMGRQYIAALQALGVRAIRICARSSERLEAFRGVEGIETVAGGMEQLRCQPQADELGIVATPTEFSVAATERLVALGFRQVLIEKPVSLWSDEIQQLGRMLAVQGVEGWVAYNRVAYPSFHEVKACAARDGGITSCAYTFTEMIRPDWPQRFPVEELARWGIANSLHVMSMAHGLIGWPTTWSGHRSGSMTWHPTGAAFVGSGVSDRAIPFAYHADWGSTGRWSVEIHTSVASYRLCPLEKVFRRTMATGDWTDMPVTVFAPQVKAGIIEEVAAALDARVREVIPLVSLEAAAALTRYGEEIFGYDNGVRRA